MSLETGTYISDLVITNPTGSDAKSQGDDHIRLLKSTIKTTFPNVAGAVTPTHTELNFVDGVTSSIQTQIDTKGAKAGQAWTGAHDFSGASGVTLPAATSIGTVSADELAYVDGVTSAIQTQIDSKGAITGQTWTGTHAFASTVSFGTVSATEVSYLDGVTSAIQTQMDTKGAKAGQVWTGTQDFTGATTTVATPSSGAHAVTKTYADGLAFASALPAQAGNSGKFVTTDGTTASWSALPATLHVHVRDEKASGTGGGTPTSGWNVRTLNTVNVNTLTGASLASSILTLPAGTFDFFASAPGLNPKKLSLYNHTDSADIMVGQSSSSGSQNIVYGRFTLATTKDVKLRTYITTTSANDLGQPASTGDVEVYAELRVWKVA